MNKCGKRLSLQLIALQMRRYFVCFLIVISFTKLLVLSSCANIIPPTGGPKDTIPPVLVNSVPKDSLTSFNAKNIVLTFDEFVQLDNVQDNVVVSPNPETVPTITSKLKNVTIKLKDSLLPNTTYTINFGNGLKDVNEGNVKKNFSYVFSTGKFLDHDVISGKVILAQTGAIDTTLVVVLQKNRADSAIIKHRPTYYTKLDHKGNFQFRNLPPDSFAIYALPNDYSKKYDDSTKMFAFLNKPVIAADSGVYAPVALYAFEQFKEQPKKPSSGQSTTKKQKPSDEEKEKAEEEKKHLRFTSNLENEKQDILKKFEMTFNHKLKVFDTSKISFMDTNYNVIRGAVFKLDTSATVATLSFKWPLSSAYRIVFQKTAFADSAGIMLTKNDTLNFTTKGEGDYGIITLRFVGLDLSKNPVLQMVQNDKVVDSAALTSAEWHREIYEPGDYQMRILFDDNKNGTWDAGDFKKKIQPEIVQAIPDKLTIRKDWENEAEINLNAPPPSPAGKKNH